jgi:hypothetical protein
VTNNNRIIIPNPPYSPALSPYDVAFFPKLKMKLKGRRFEVVSHIQREWQAVLDSIKENDFYGALEAWGGEMGSLCTFQEDYFEGDGSRN